MKNNFQSNGKGRSQRVWQLLISMLFILTMGIGQMWAATDAPTGVRNQSSLTYAATDTLHRGGKIYEIFWCNPTSGDIKTKLVKKTHNSTNYEAAGSDKFCVVGSSVGTTTASATANTIDEFTWTASSSPRYWRIRRDGIANYQIVLVVKGYDGVAALHKANADLLIKVERYNTATSSYVAYSPKTTSVSSAVSSHYKTYASLDAADQFRITFYGSGTSGTNNRDMLAFSLSVPTYTVTLNPSEGSYASTPSGWTESAGKYTKTVLAGALTIPEPTSASYSFTGWKSGETAITLTDGKLTVAKDTTLVAQWSSGGSCTAPTDVTISANGGAAHIVGDDVTLTASASNVSASTEYAWYKGATLEAAEAAGAIQTAKTAAAGGTTYSIASCELESAGKYWCVVWNAEGCETSASLDLTVSAVPHTVTYKPGDGSGPESIVDLSATVVADCPVAFSYAGHVFAGWKDALNNDVAVGAAVTSDMELTAQWNEIVNYTIALDANGGTIASYEGWTKVDDVYSKEVAEGTEVSLLAFTKAGLQLMFFRDGSANEYSSAVTVNANLNLKAVWGEEKEVTLYSWESPAGTPVEVGGTAKYYIGDDDNSSVTSGNRVNYANKPIDGDAVTQYYTLSLNKAVDYSTDHVRIILDEELKSGDEIEITAYYTKDSEKTIAPKIANGSDVEICSADNLPNLYSGGTPSVQTKTLNASAEGATTLKLTRSATSTTVFITKLVITGTRVVEEMDPAQTPSITVQPTGANYTWKDAVAALTVTAAVTDGGTLHYQWYKEAGENDTKVGTDANSYTPEESGTYYVVVTNKKTGFEDALATSDNAVVNIAARPSYTVTYYDGSTSLGTESVLEDASPAEYAAKQTKAYHEFVNWKNNADVVITPASLVVTKDTALYGNWTANYAFGDYSFVNVAEVGTAPNKLTMTDGTTVNVAAGSRVDNLYFSEMAIKYESGASDALNNYKGWKINTNNATISFLVENDAQVKVGIGSTTNVNVLYTNTDGDAQDVTLTQQSEGSYKVKGGTIVTLRTTNNSTTTLKYIKIGDIPAQSDDASLSDLKVGGTTITGFSSTKYQYYVELPYGTAHADFPVVTVTTNEEHAVAVVNDAKDRTDDITVVHVTAQDGVAEKYYNVYFSVAPKVGVEVFAYTPVGSNGFKDATGYKGGKADIYLQTSKTQGGYKLGSVGHYIGIAVDGGLKANDLICIDIADLQGASALTFFDGKTDGKTQVITPAPTPKVGKNYVTVPSDMDSIYLYRADGTCNPSVISVAVYREMESFFETFTVAGVDATIDETVSPKTITVEVPAVTDITALTPTYKAWANGGATVSPTTAQDFSAGAVEYTVTSAYSEATTYQVTVTKAAAIKEVVISGTLTVQEDATTTLSAVVYDTYDNPAAIQGVTWSVKAGDEDLASVDANGVVTGKAVGTAHIIATSVADSEISAQVAVEVTENPCRAWVNPSTRTETITLGYLKVKPVDIEELKNLTPYSGATAANSWKLNARDGKYAELNFSDGTQFDALTIGVTSNQNTSETEYKYAVVLSSAAGAGFDDGIIETQVFNAGYKDAAEALVNVVIPANTRAVRIMRQHRDGSTNLGGSSSVYLYYIRACKKALVPVTSVALADATLAQGHATTPVMTVNPTNADVISVAWSFVDATAATAAGLSINATTGAISATATAVVGAYEVKVTVTDALSVVKEATCTVNVIAEYTQVDVTGDITWNWANAGENVNKGTGSAEGLMANETGITNDASFNSQALWYQGSRPNYVNGITKCAQVYKLKFHTTVAGVLTIKYSSNGDTQKAVKIGDITGEYSETGGGTSGATAKTKTFNIAANTDVLIEGVLNDGNPAEVRIFMMDFNTHFDMADADYIRNVTEGRYGTICLPNGGVMVGAAVFEIAYMDYKDNKPYKIYFDEIANGTMVAGRPYIFLPNESVTQLGVFYTDAAGAAAGSHRGLYGSYSEINLTANDGNYILLNNMYYYVNSDNVYCSPNRAYIKLADVPDYDPGKPAYGRRRVALDVHSEQVATGIGNTELSEQPMKVMINGQLYILRGEQMFDATGRLVK